LGPGAREAYFEHAVGMSPGAREAYSEHAVGMSPGAREEKSKMHAVGSAPVHTLSTPWVRAPVLEKHAVGGVPVHTKGGQSVEALAESLQRHSYRYETDHK
jgi:hypothetical protein